MIFPQTFELEAIESQIFCIATFNSSKVDGWNKFSIPFIIDQTNSIGERSGELGGHLGIF